MSATTYSLRPNGDRASPRRRAAAFLLALAIELLLLLAFFTLNFRERDKPLFEGGRLTTFDIAAPSEAEPTSIQPKPEVAVTRPPPRPLPPVATPVVRLPPRPLDLIPMSKADLEASDIARLGSNAPGYVRSAGQGSAGDSQRVGTAPDGQPLYAAEWYREPTHTELAAYLPRHMPEGGGWGMIACKTAERFRVTDCVELGNSPPGSHLAGAVRQAAWQFLVRPPRVGGKPLIGEWVRIRITYAHERSAGGSN